jgi:hypothetical protein
MLGAQTLIPAGSTLYEQIARLSVGEKVIFSGTFAGGKDFVEETSLTEEGSMNAPEFLFSFSGIRPANQAPPSSSVTDRNYGAREGAEQRFLQACIPRTMASGAVTLAVATNSCKCGLTAFEQTGSQEEAIQAAVNCAADTGTMR